jgi:hypothetical protein
MSELPLEKQFAHTMFCQQLQGLEIDNAKKLLADLHLLYLGQQAMFAELIKQDTFRSV